MSVEEFEHLSMIICVGGLIAYMLFIIYKLGQESKAGTFGYFILFIALGLGIFGFVAKTIIVEWMGL